MCPRVARLYGKHRTTITSHQHGLISPHKTINFTPIPSPPPHRVWSLHKEKLMSGDLGCCSEVSGAGSGGGWCIFPILAVDVSGQCHPILTTARPSAILILHSQPLYPSFIQLSLRTPTTLPFKLGPENTRLFVGLFSS